MIFFPFKADLDHFRFPLVTILISLLCICIYINQYSNEQRVLKTGNAFCEDKGSVMWRLVLQKSAGRADYQACSGMMWDIHLSDDREATIRKYAQQGKPLTGLSADASFKQKQSVIAERYRDFEHRVPAYNTQQLWYQPRSWNVWHMITAAFAHASWGHIIGNLFFFLAFAVTVEVILGPALFGAVILALALGTHSFYSVAMLGVAEPLPTVGLSGVVMGVMALFAFFLPHGKIKCFFWFLVYFRVFALPAWLLFAWYAGWDAYELLVNSDQRSGINLVAHVSGAAIGYLLGIMFFRTHRNEVRGWQPREQYSV